ncbi:MAG: HIT family protein [Deltaproteobacteria bacterium]|nr:HIT family protein [Deltaproteobacteria bacterium]
MEDCIFCRIARGELPCHKVYEDDKVIAFEDISPVSEGHTLVVPKQHAENLFEISAEDLTAVHLAGQKIVRAIRKALDPVGVAVLQLNGRGVNQIVMHYHVHLIPRAAGGPALPVSDWGAQEGDPEALAGTAGKIAAVM